MTGLRKWILANLTGGPSPLEAVAGETSAPVATKVLERLLSDPTVLRGAEAEAAAIQEMLKAALPTALPREMRLGPGASPQEEDYLAAVVGSLEAIITGLKTARDYVGRTSSQLEAQREAARSLDRLLEPGQAVDPPSQKLHSTGSPGCGYASGLGRSELMEMLMGKKK